jgi:hypothetical protein
MNRIPVDQSRMTLVALSVTPNLDESKQQKTDYDGVPVWTIECLHRPEQTGDFQPKAEVIQVRIPSRAEPQIEPMSEVLFDGLTARQWSMNGRSGISLSADAFVDAATGALPDLDGGK